MANAEFADEEYAEAVAREVESAIENWTITRIGAS